MSTLSEIITFVDQRADPPIKFTPTAFAAASSVRAYSKIFAFSAGCRYHGNWGYGNALIHDRYAQFSDTFTYACQVFSAGGDFVVDFAACPSPSESAQSRSEIPMVTVRISSFLPRSCEWFRVFGRSS